MKAARILPLFWLLSVLGAQRQVSQYDLVIVGGRVMDPESGLDAVRHIGIRGGKIAAVSERPLAGKISLQAVGRVVAPGFIDLHAHGQTNEANEYQAHDGVTTALELEVGVPSVGVFLKSREHKSMLNFGATSSHGAMRVMILSEFAAETAAWQKSTLRWNEIGYKGRYKTLSQPEEYT